MQFRLNKIQAWGWGLAEAEAEAKELGSVPMLLEGRHTLHGVGHHGHSPQAHLPPTPEVHQVGVPESQRKSQYF